MKSKQLLLSLFLIAQVLSAQNYQSVEDINNACATLGFSSNEDAEIAVDRIMDIIGLPKNFTLQECPHINNAVAKNIKNESGRFVRYILYDNEFFQRMDNQAANDWAAVSILAHEIGHHLSGHSLNNDGSNHQYELEADYFSGMILAKMGASLNETQSAINTLRYEKATSTHPAKADRLNEINKGWSKGNKNNNTNATTTEEVDPIVEFYLENAKNGDASAQSHLGYLYDIGKEIPQDYEQAIYWYQKAAEQDNTDAIYNLGTLYYHGNGVDMDFYIASTWYHKAALLGHIGSQYTLATMLNYGKVGLEKNVEGALYWFNEAAKQEDANSQLFLGYMYESGGEIPIDYDLAYYWYTKAATFGLPGAQYNLGVMYYNGTGIKENKAEGIIWFKKAAKQDFKEAKEYLISINETW